MLTGCTNRLNMVKVHVNLLGVNEKKADSLIVLPRINKVNSFLNLGGRLR